ncbi:hypothetical protein [Chitinophaga sp. Cy-1792]|uniref:hypothetical protein n=1 Tax=Chitinophaga sp. Cy-1792 TaxID=2608339 RepID=UPI001422B7CE|nr:hypothetical protein [Chitinophaga sp. Cy-1792]NIG57253.1 hypothetical protein [Chitinophaga sp. Cy-1792]
MADIYYPTVSTAFILACVKASGKLEKDGIIKIGKTTNIILAGPQAIFKRTCTFRELEAGELTYENATGLAIRLGFMGKLLDWLYEHKNWKDGAYLEKAV